MTEKDPEKQRAAKKRVEGWIDRPEHKPTELDDALTRDHDISDPAYQVPEEPEDE